MYSNNLTWSSYVNGFFHDSDNYWLGLKNMAVYNKDLTRIGIQLNFSSSTVFGYILQEYFSFAISDSSAGYSYTVGSIASSARSLGGSGSTQGFNLGNLFDLGENTHFSTYDRDQDNDSGRNCASLAGAGWWFKSCTPQLVVNPLGLNYVRNPGAPAEAFVLLPKYDTALDGPKESFRHVYIYLKP